MEELRDRRSAPSVTIRLARPGDARTLGAIAADPSPQAEARFSERLSIAHGDDYFCLVAEQGEPLGYLLAGGTRDADRKGYGEVYELAVHHRVRRRGIARALLSAAEDRFRAAAYAGTLISVPADDAVAQAFAHACGLAEDPPGPGASARRYGRALSGPGAAP